MERCKGQGKYTLRDIGFIRRLFFQFASGFGIYAATYGFNSGSDDVPGRSAANAGLVNLGV
jgi:hypothetical protein